MFQFERNWLEPRKPLLHWLSHRSNIGFFSVIWHFLRNLVKHFRLEATPLLFFPQFSEGCCTTIFRLQCYSSHAANTAVKHNPSCALHPFLVLQSPHCHPILRSPQLSSAANSHLFSKRFLSKDFCFSGVQQFRPSRWAKIIKKGLISQHCVYA